MKIVPFSHPLLLQAVELFIANLRELRRQVPTLPDLLTHPEQAAAQLAEFLTPYNALAALDGGQLLGYLGWWLVPDFRGTGRKGSFCPEFGHAARPEQAARIYRMLYAEASRRWTEEGCQLHALTLLAGNAEVERTWFESGFGMILHDAIRPMIPIDAQAARGMAVRRAEQSDVEELARLDAEHNRHYSQPPVFMAPREGKKSQELARFLSEEPNAIWLAEADGLPQAFMSFQRASEGAARIVQSPQTIAITGAFTRPTWRGRGAATAILDAALRDYAARGFERMSVDYETINPEALAFWPRYFTPVAVSLVRVPEVVG